MKKKQFYFQKQQKSFEMKFLIMTLTYLEM